MIHISKMQDLSAIRDDPELQREVISYLLYCQYEIQEYSDEYDLDDHDFNMFILDKHERSYINDLGPPEETVQTRIECCGEVRVFRRLVYVTEIIIYEESNL
jgi:hypothetical protein